MDRRAFLEAAAAVPLARQADTGLLRRTFDEARQHFEEELWRRTGRRDLKNFVSVSASIQHAAFLGFWFAAGDRRLYAEIRLPNGLTVGEVCELVKRFYDLKS